MTVEVIVLAYLWKQLGKFMEMDESINVFGEELEGSNSDPVTGFFRDNKCNTCEQDTWLTYSVH